jgi:V8-like Glu-specific endopeptidase
MQAFRLTCVAALFVAGSIHAAPQDVVVMPAGQVDLSQAKTTPDYRHAQSVLPGVKSLPARAFDFNAAASLGRTAPIAAENGHSGAIADAKGLAQRLFDIPADEQPQQMPAGVTPNAVGTQGLQFTTSQIGPQAVDTTYPSRATGKLWFQQPGSTGWWVCSGSMIKPGIVLTAGHCVSSGSGAWYSSFQFVPGYRSGAAPYGTWTSWASATTTSEWFSGGGGVPNGGDYALIVFNKNSSGYRIGDYTGWFGWQYPSVVGKEVTVLGYPVNLDSGLINHRVDAQATSGSSNTGLWGSDMTGGSSGGGVVLNYSYAYSSSTSLPSDDGVNRLVSVVSYGPTTTGPMYQGGSVFDSRISTMLTNMCTSYAWAC